MHVPNGHSVVCIGGRWYVFPDLVEGGGGSRTSRLSDGSDTARPTSINDELSESLDGREVFAGEVSE